MEFFPSMAVFLKIGFLEIRWYAICILTGAIIVYFLAGKQFQKAGYDSDLMDDLFVGALTFGIIGARLWYCVFYDFVGYFSNPVSILRIWDGGLAIHGGLFFGAGFVIWYCLKHNISFLHIGDIALPYVLIAQATGRWGNYFNQEAFGNIVDGTYFDGFLAFLKKGMYIAGAYRQPMFFYESCLCLFGFVLIQLYRKYSQKNRGDGMYCYLAWYGVIRFWIEAQRTDSLMFFGLKTAQIISIAFMVIGILGLMGFFNRFIYKEKPAVIFDLDGTLLDTGDCIKKSFEHVLSIYQPDLVLTEEDKASFLGPTLQQSFEKYAPGQNVDELIACYREYNTAIHKETVKEVQGAKQLVLWLKDHGYPVAIASSKKVATIRLGLSVCDMNELFDVIVGVDDVQRVKPDKQTIDIALQRLKAKRSCAIYVGDSASDIVCAKNAGVYSVGITTNTLFVDKLKAAKPNEIIDRLEEIEEIVAQKHPFTYNLK